jgi:hypothetical protein
MATCSNAIHVTKRLLVWAMPIPDPVAVLFAMVFVNLYELVKYITKDITKTDTFHLIIPLDCLEDLLNDPVYKFPQVRRIDVYHDDMDDLTQVQHYVNPKCGRVQFCSVYDFPRYLECIEFDNALVSTNSIDRNIIHAIISSIRDRISAKRSITSIRSPQLLQNPNLTISCLSCEWIGPLKAYQVMYNISISSYSMIIFLGAFPTKSSSITPLSHS